MNLKNHAEGGYLPDAIIIKWVTLLGKFKDKRFMITVSTGKRVLAESLNRRDVLSKPQSYYMYFLMNALVIATHLNTANRLNATGLSG